MKTGHEKETELVKWHPTAANVLGSTSMDKTVKIWDASEGKDVITIGLPNKASDLQWNRNGKFLATCDIEGQMFGVFDPRTDASKPVQEYQPAAGSKVNKSRVLFMNAKGKDYFAIFGKYSGSTYLWLYDTSNTAEPVSSSNQSFVQFLFEFYLTRRANINNMLHLG